MVELLDFAFIYYYALVIFVLYLNLKRAKIGSTDFRCHDVATQLVRTDTFNENSKSDFDL
ncbi:hypothetical protein BpHYR1_005283 [Brachionus plicatilis]|uniref:Uncharacterized protein n=1 Tax=Brachionus plicatilis TaxID=10195 RepID=A0A3M7R7I3_BRAPC|nr:hypothetical protein BpHYR1_005283 [Brachionus plicatilis]